MGNGLDGGGMTKIDHRAPFLKYETISKKRKPESHPGITAELMTTTASMSILGSVNSLFIWKHKPETSPW